MDVRCERCQTEYELDDASVSDAGTPVQCTTCGYTFLVRRDASEDTVEEPPPADWLLETSDGQMHRFRNLTSLQKWIIERKVTRQDKISRTGHAWRRLGEIVELAPFFDVVDDADRARATSAMAARDLVSEAEAARRAGQNAPAAPRAPAPGELSGRSPSPPARRATPMGGMDGGNLRGSADFEPLHPGGSGGFRANGGEMQTSVVRVGGGARMLKAVAGLVVAGGVAFVGITQPWKKPTSIGVAEPVAAPVVQPPPVIQVAPPPVASPPPASPPPTEVAQAESPPAAAPAPVAAAGKPTPPRPAKEPAANDPAAKAAPAHGPAGGKAYDRLVSEADRLLENGNSARAMKLFDQALALKPTGPEALAGMGYVNLDKGRAEIAIGYFRKSLSGGMFAPAQFGLAEAQRAAGDKSGALESYKKYLEVSPGGGDSSAARRQIKAIEAGGSATAKTEAAPSANEPPPTPSSVLSEPAKP